MKKKLFTLLLAVAASIGTMVAADAIGRLNYGGLYYVLYTDYTATLTNNNGAPYSFANPTRVTIPSSIEYNNESYTVTAIADGTFSLCGNLYEIVIPETIWGIGNKAFSYTGLDNVVIPNSVTFIGETAFLGCSRMTSIILSEELTSIRKGCFQGCSSLESIVIPDKVTSIGQVAFWSCSGLTSVTIGESVSSIYTGCFNSTDNITTVVWKAINCDGYNFGSQVTSFAFGNNVEAIPSHICDGMNLLDNITIPNSVTSIGTGAFRDCSGLASITIPNNVTSIGGSAFSGCSGLTSMTIPNGVTSIGGSTFENCTGLTSVTIPNSVTNIGGWAFDGCSSLTSVTVPNRVTIIGEKAFNNCSGLTGELIIPSSVQNIFRNAFANCISLTSIVIEGHPRLGANSFNGCTNLQGIYCLSNTPPIANAEPGCLSNTNDCPIYYPCGMYENYKYVFTMYLDRLYQNPDCARTFTVTFQDWNGTVLKSEQVEEGQSATAPANPIREGYTFTGWDKDFSNVQSDLIVTAQYTQNSSGTTSFTVTFQDWDGTVLKSEQVDKGKSATAPANPTREGYTFTGWDKTFSNVQSDLIVTAQYQKNAEIAVTNVSLNKKTLQMVIGNTATVTASVLPANASNKSVTWTSSNATTATVSSTGTISAKAEGVTTITCKTIDGNFTAECYVVVSAVNSEYTFSYEPTNATVINYTATELSYSEIPENNCVFAALADNAHSLHLMYVGSLVNGKIPQGNYKITSTLQNGTFCYSVGGDDQYDYGSYMATDYDSEGYYTSAYYIIAGDITIGSKNNYTVKVVSANGTDINVTYAGTQDVEIVPSEIKASKILRNGQIFILRGEKVYTLQGQEVR